MAPAAPPVLPCVCGPSPTPPAAIVTTLNKSVAVALLDDSVPGWYKINYNGSTGYVSADYLIIDQDNIFTTYGRVPEGTVNVRAAATTDSERPGHHRRRHHRHRQRSGKRLV